MTHRPALLALGLAIALPAVAQAQSPSPQPRTTPWYVSVSHYGRWVALAASAGFIAVAVNRHDQASQEYQALVLFCHQQQQRCVLGTDGKYLDPVPEARFQETLKLDARAGRWIMAGQITLFAAGGMFLIDILDRDHSPKNIPYTPFEAYAAPGRLGLQMRF